MEYSVVSANLSIIVSFEDFFVSCLQQRGNSSEHRIFEVVVYLSRCGGQKILNLSPNKLRTAIKQTKKIALGS